MKIMQVKVQVGRAETASAEVLVLTHCEGEGLAKQDAALLDRALGGTLRKLVQSKEFEGKIKVFKLNTDENPNVASQYGIRSIPTLMVFKGGQKVDTVVGAVPKATLSGTISKHL